MICPKCESHNVNVTADTNTESVNRSILFDVFMVVITCGLWIVWMLFRGSKEKEITKAIAVCQNCGYMWEV